MTEPLSRTDILNRFPDTSFHDRLLALSGLASFLHNCIVDDNYDIPTKLANAIKLTNEGNALVLRLQNNASPRNECIVSVFLELWWVDLLVDPVNTDIDELAAAISDEIVKGRLRYPYIYGRVLYDKAFDEFQDGRDILSHKDTMTLLAGSAQGVFQMGEFVSGPYGLLKSATYRFSPPRVYFPLYHCEDIACGAFHRTRLTTGTNVKVAKVHSRLRELLDKKSQVHSAWAEVLGEREDAISNPFSWQHPGGLIRFLGDCFSINEHRQIVADLFDNTRGDLRSRLTSAGITVKSAEVFASSLEAAEVLQVILLCSDDDIIASIDALVLSRNIHIPDTELRRAAVRAAGGYFHLIPECSNRGVRFTAGFDLSYLRVNHLLSTLFDTNDEASRNRLRWLTRGTEGSSFQEQLDQYLYSHDLSDVVRTLAFDSEQNLESSKKFVALSNRATSYLVGDESLASAVNWRLGIGTLTNDEELSLFQSFGKRLTELVMRTHSYTTTDQADIRGAASNFFEKLEGLLRSYLKMATWVMYRDHYASSEGFTYADSRATQFAAQVLGGAQEKVSYSADGKWTLFPLARGFSILADVLDSIQKEPQKFARPDNEFPRILTENVGPYSFLFKHRHLFLDLSDSSRLAILSLLREASRKLTSGKVDEVRNLLGHNNPFPQQGDILLAVNSALAVISEAEEAGLLPLVAEVHAESRDLFGRRTITVGTARGEIVRIVRPSPHFLSGVPGADSPQFVVRAATYAQSSELVRLGPSEASEYAALWENFPRRRAVSQKDSGSSSSVVLGA